MWDDEGDNDDDVDNANAAAAADDDAKRAPSRPIRPPK